MTITDRNSSFELLAMLADGQVHSGSDLAARLGISRTAVWKRIAKLPELGIDVTKVPSRGYKLAGPIEFLDSETLCQTIHRSLPNEPLSLEVHQQVESTNKVLLDRVGSLKGAELVVVLAEHQTGGRGRRGRQWCSPCARNIYMSVLWSTDQGLQALDGLSLAIGVSVAKMLRNDFDIPATLKWPNDIHVNGKKIAGILIEIDGDIEGPLSVVVGVGLNVQMSAEETATIEQPWTHMAAHLSSAASRNDVAARMIVRLAEGLSQFRHQGFGAFRDQWAEMDAYLGRNVVVTGHGGPHVGIEKGVDDKGALLLEVDGEVMRMLSGDVSLRVLP